jgi:hypothetical protein
MDRESYTQAEVAGRLWAEQKADMLRGNIPAMDWPELWLEKWAGKLPFDASSVAPRDRAALLAAANVAAARRWGELVEQCRESEDVLDEETDEEADAVQLYEAVRAGLPRGLVAGRDGPRVYLEDTLHGTEHTVRSLEDAWRVVEEWRERHA